MDGTIKCSISKVPRRAKNRVVLILELSRQDYICSRMSSEPLKRFMTIMKRIILNHGGQFSNMLANKLCLYLPQFAFKLHLNNFENYKVQEKTVEH